MIGSGFWPGVARVDARAMCLAYCLLALLIAGAWRFFFRPVAPMSAPVLVVKEAGEPPQAAGPAWPARLDAPANPFESEYLQTLIELQEEARVAAVEETESVPEPPLAPPPEPEPKIEVTLEFRGVLKRPDGPILGLIHVTPPDQSKYVRPGEIFEGFAVEAIGQKTMTVIQGTNAPLVLFLSQPTAVDMEGAP